MQTPPCKIVCNAATYATDMQLRCKIDHVNNRWTRPPSRYMELNIDGSFRDGRGTYGGILRDEINAKWVWRFFGKCTNFSPLHAELIGLCEGVQNT